MKEYGNAVFIRHGGDFATFCGGLGSLRETGAVRDSGDEDRAGGRGNRAGADVPPSPKGKTVDPAPFLGTSTEP